MRSVAFLTAQQAERLGRIAAHCERIDIHSTEPASKTLLALGWVGQQIAWIEVLEAEPTVTTAIDIGLPLEPRA